MTQEVAIWHNPRCSKSRATLALLNELGHQPRLVLYLDEPPSASEIKRVLALLGYQPRELMRTKEPLYVELGLAEVDDQESLIRAMAEHPILIERPLVISGNGAALGRPPENVLAILQSSDVDG